MRNPHKKPRVAYCTGCTRLFEKMHYMINHRRTERCGGRFLTADQLAVITMAHERGESLKEFRPSLYRSFKS